MLGPWLTPENTKSGRSGNKAPSASSTQSVGVPSTWYDPSGRRAGRRGRCIVRLWEVPLCSRSGAMTVTSPTVWHTSASRERPGARIPSSLETRMFMWGGNLLGRRFRLGRWNLAIENEDDVFDRLAQFPQGFPFDGAARGS